MDPAEALAYLCVAAIPLSWGVAILLRRVANADPDLPILAERAGTGWAVALLVTVFALIFLNNDQPIPPLDTYTTKIATRATVLIVALVTSIRWLWLYFRPPVRPPV